MHGSQGISWMHLITGKILDCGVLISNGCVFPGLLFRISHLFSHSAGTQTSLPSDWAICLPEIFPEKMAADASAISRASPAE